MVSLMDRLIGSSVIVTRLYVNCNLRYMTSWLAANGGVTQPCPHDFNSIPIFASVMSIISSQQFVQLPP